MTHDSRVVWTEGLFLRPQHFQQQDRWVDGLVRGAVRGIVEHGYGFRALRLDQGLLTTGKVALESADGILPDGTPFSVPGGADHPEPHLPAEPAKIGMRERPLVGGDFKVLRQPFVEPQGHHGQTGVQQRVRAFVSQIDVELRVAVSVHACQPAFAHKQRPPRRHVREMSRQIFAMRGLVGEQVNVHRVASRFDAERPHQLGL